MPDDQENIEEAIHHVNTALLPSKVSFVFDLKQDE